jgi:hypothetical protein
MNERQLKGAGNPSGSETARQKLCEKRKQVAAVLAEKKSFKKIP